MKESIKLTVRLFLITAIAGFILAFANSFTSPVIKEREKTQYEAALKEVFVDADKFETLEDFRKKWLWRRYFNAYGCKY